MPEAPSDWLHPALRRMGLLHGGAACAVHPLEGGVSSDIYRVDLPSGPICVKRALPRLKVATLWEAPVERNRWEAEWLRVAGTIAPQFVPRVLGEDAESGSFAMGYLPPDGHPVWKAQLRDGAIEPFFAAEVALHLARIHNETAGNLSVEQRFATDHVFHAIRLEPYLHATAKRHPDRATELAHLADATAGHKVALVHGDVSPKNILAGPHGPLLLDAECAWYGDPAFDLAFCLNHMLLKCLWRPQWRDRYLECFDSLASSYLGAARYEPRAVVETRTARLLPGLFLARVDGKSPVEYVTEDADRERVRRVARALLAEPVDSLADVRAAWHEELAR